MTDGLSRDKVEAKRTPYPRGYVEMLERQQTQLVTGLQMMYRTLVDIGSWTGERLPRYKDCPATHDILDALGVVSAQNVEQPDSMVPRFQDIHRVTNFKAVDDSTTFDLLDDNDGACGSSNEAGEILFGDKPSSLLADSIGQWQPEKESTLVVSPLALAERSATTMNHAAASPGDDPSATYSNSIFHQPLWTLTDDVNNTTNLANHEDYFDTWLTHVS